MNHRDCIPPPAPLSWWHTWRLARQLDRLERSLASSPPPPSKAWRAVEATAIDTVKPTAMKKSKRNSFVASEPTTSRCLGVVSAADYVEAAFRTAREIFGKSAARRESGRPGDPGVFSAFSLSNDDEISFHLEAT